MRAESSLLGYAECSRYSTKVNREGRRRSQNEGEANGYGNQSFGVNVDTACCLNYHQTVIIKKSWYDLLCVLNKSGAKRTNLIVRHEKKEDDISVLKLI